MAYALVANNWEDLRKQARVLENEIDIKLVSFSKLGIGDAASSYKSLSDTSVPQSKGQSFEIVAAEVQQLLDKLTELNENMEEMASSEVHTSSAVLHTLQRHREILQDYKQEFHKMQANYQARRDREDLLKSVRKDIDNYKSSSGLNRRLDLCLKENEHIRSSDRLIDEQISIAVDTREHLMSQRLSLKRFQTKLNDISNRFPIVNSLIQRVNVRKHRDSLILGLVIGVCTVFLIFYATS
ncbi:Golgi SNAP receptor complex member 1 [Bacillus rossius redtenbacheri]|uniref:Golgi SNAP receptor complex member 1 n=1 Tax=Bacillus rossius redtenbacheri TaxID=93214 RepID=UPI002FDC7ADC